MNAATRDSNVELFAIHGDLNDPAHVKFEPITEAEGRKEVARSKIKFDTYMWVKATKGGAVARIADDARKRTDLVALLNGHDLPTSEQRCAIRSDDAALEKGAEHVTDQVLKIPCGFGRRWSLAE
jgi:hypothetical protein